MSTLAVSGASGLRRSLRRVRTPAAELLLASEQTREGSDHCELWEHPGYTDIWLVDTNNLSLPHANALIGLVTGLLGRLSADRADIDDMLGQARELATNWLAVNVPATRERFVNAALIRVAGYTVEFTGAFAPAYIWEGGPVLRWTPSGTVWGVPHLLAEPAGQRSRYTLQAPGALVLASDGMLESRNSSGKINGDTIIMDYFASSAEPMDRLESIFDLYAEKAHERDDSFQLFALSTRQEPRAQTADESLILFKADAYELSVADNLEGLLATWGLRVTRKFQVRFTEDAVFALWPKIYGRRWTTSLLGSMSGCDLDVWLISGSDAVMKVVSLKDQVRRQRSDPNSYRNILHSPDSGAAFAREYSMLRRIEVAP